ncbi:urease accessory protein UreD [Citreimonas salinaria]|uniref:Urease accessory protein UreD n=1 Tax=Citreimonas salinaria TaxID=321339 RepID=A0A1H3H9Z5_9RHOB|nr:urease accessory protein UreD [Citreimonas salinaria]SDY12237.1 urease accessory protein [Citreimonas salinaria]
MPGIEPPAAAQRARGAALLAAHAAGGRTRIADLSMSGCAKLLFPRPAGPALDAVLLNASGGVTGGDRLALEVRAGPGAAARMTTQAAERVYRAPVSDAPGRVETALTVEAGAVLHWLPQETILFDGAALDRRLRIDMGGDARLIACEVLVFGRAAMGEVLRALRLRDRIDLRREGRLVFADRLRLEGDAAAALARAGVAGGAGAMASVLWAAPEAGARVDALRAALPATAGASALDSDLVFLRLLGRDGYALRKSLIPLLERLTETDLPRPWML